jgi:predicted GIY-YIG superfamily endonuclease
MNNGKHVVYVLESITYPERHYTGLCKNVQQRLRLHNEGLSHHTARYKPWRLVVSLEFSDRSTAARFERYLKSGSGRAFARRHFGNDKRDSLIVSLVSNNR